MKIRDFKKLKKGEFREGCNVFESNTREDHEILSCLVKKRYDDSYSPPLSPVEGRKERKIEI